MLLLAENQMILQGVLRGESLKYRQGKVKVFERAREQIIYQEKPYGVGAESIIL